MAARLLPLVLLVGATLDVSAAVWGRSPQAAAPSGYSYTPEQAERGRTVYAAHCAMCHGTDMAGADEFPSLTGARFDSHWRNRPADLYSKVKLSMPQDDPGSLSPADATAVVAAILHANGVPANK